MTCIAYIRVSTERQADGNGLEQQRRSICMYAAAAGLHIDEWIEDDESGTTEDREGIQKLLARSEAFTLVFDRVDRLGRTVLVSESLFAKFAARGVRVLCVAQELDDTKPSGRMIRQMMGVVAEFQRSEMLLRLSQSKRAAKAKRGTYGGGNVPYGFSAVGGGQLAADPCTVRLVRRTHEIAAQQRDASYRAIAECLTAEGFRTRKGTELSAMQVSRILKRKAVYAGQQNVGNVPLDQGVLPRHERII